MKKNKKQLALWQERYERNKAAYSAETDKMDDREAQYKGSNKIDPISRDERKTKTAHVRNLSAELVEAQVSSEIPQPKVTARRKEDEHLAKLIEDMLRNELDRLPFEMMNDQQERTVPIQGGSAFLVEWDNSQRTHTSIGELAVNVVHPKQIIPQDGVFTGIEDMDYIFLDVPQTKESIKRRYGVDVSDQSESEPDIKGSEGEGNAQDMVTQHIVYFRNGNGGLGVYSWVNDVELEYLEDYQARRLRRCKTCGAVEPLDSEPMEEALQPDGNLPESTDPWMPEEAAPLTAEEVPSARSGRGRRKACPYCGGSKWEDSQEEFEEIWTPIKRKMGEDIPGARPVAKPTGMLDEFGQEIIETELEPTRIPFYKPDIYPIVLRKNVSVFGRFLGDSDMDKIRDQQNTTNRLEAKIIDKLVASGSYITLPPDASIKVDGDDMKVIRLTNPADKQLIDVYNMQGDISQDMAYLSQVYEEARQVIGITDSFQGRRDTTATSGKAKEFSAAQSAGRLESKRVMKEACYAALFEAMFKFKLAYADEPRPVYAKDNHGRKVYEEFNRYDFLLQDAAGEWYWNDQFLFSCDTSAPLAANREAMWQETRMYFAEGAFGDPKQLQTLILFWDKMDMLHYPGAKETKAYLEEQLQQQMAEMQARKQAERIVAAEDAAAAAQTAAQGQMM